jgi:hypothetical protein
MAFVPGFDHDVFISYAHGDDCDWISRFSERLDKGLRQRLPGAAIWIDEKFLGRSQNYGSEIPASLESLQC